VRRALVLLIAVVVLAGCGGGGGSGSGSRSQSGNEANVMRQEHAPPAPAKQDKREDPIPTLPPQQP